MAALKSRRAESRLPILSRWLWFQVDGCSVHLPVNLPSNPVLWMEPPHVQARWADLECVAHASDPWFNEREIARTDSTLASYSHGLIDLLMSTSNVGNVAYMATSAAVPEPFRERWVSIAARIRWNWFPWSVEDDEKASYRRVDYCAPGEWLHVESVSYFVRRYVLGVFAFFGLYEWRDTHMQMDANGQNHLSTR